MDLLPKETDLNLVVICMIISPDKKYIYYIYYSKSDKELITIKKRDADTGNDLEVITIPKGMLISFTSEFLNILK